MNLKLSACNQLQGTIIALEPGAVNTLVKLQIGEEVVTSIITNNSAQELGLKIGQKAFAVIKASNVMIGVE